MYLNLFTTDKYSVGTRVCSYNFVLIRQHSVWQMSSMHLSAWICLSLDGGKIVCHTIIMECEVGEAASRSLSGCRLHSTPQT